MSKLNSKVPQNSRESIGPVHICACIIRKAKSVNLKVYLLCVILLSVMLVIFMSTDLSHKGSDFPVSEYVPLNDSEYQLLVNITETKGEL